MRELSRPSRLNERVGLIVHADVLVSGPWLKANLTRRRDERLANAHIQQPGADSREEEH